MLRAEEMGRDLGKFSQLFRQGEQKPAVAQHGLHQLHKPLNCDGAAG